jgi:dTDP-L-rhamnose 4-epimerase
MHDRRSPRRILVTGGAGFIGSHVVDAILAAGLEAVILDDLDPSVHPGAPDHVDPRATFVRASLDDSETVERTLRGTDAVCHHAAKVGMGTGLGDVVDYAVRNDTATAALLLAMHRTGFRGRLVLASSMVVYGEGRYRCADHGVVRPSVRSTDDLDAGRFEPACPRCGAPLHAEAAPEDAPLDPRNVYAATKVHQEHLCACFARETGNPMVALRYHNVYGPRMPKDTPYAGVASVFRSALARGLPPQVLEDGAQLRDFVHATDVARANVLALTAEPEVAGAFNIASGRPRTVGEMAVALADASNGPPPVVTGRYRLGDVRHVFASADKARRVLGFTARVGFEAGMRELARTPQRGDEAAAPSRHGHAHPVPA